MVEIQTDPITYQKEKKYMKHIGFQIKILYPFKIPTPSSLKLQAWGEGGGAGMCRWLYIYIYIKGDPKTLIMRVKRAHDVTTTMTSSNPT